MNRVRSIKTEFPPAAAQPAPAAPVTRTDGMPESRSERHLRRLLAARVAMPGTYLDDGEAFGAEHGITIDFMREHVAAIEAKLWALNAARAKSAAPAAPVAPCTNSDAWGAKCHQMTEAERYLTAEAIRQAFAKLPKSSFMLNAGGGISRVDDSCGNWVDWHDAHVLFDPEQVDAAIKKMEGQA